MEVTWVVLLALLMLIGLVVAGFLAATTPLGGCIPGTNATKAKEKSNAGSVD